MSPHNSSAWALAYLGPKWSNCYCDWTPGWIIGAGAEENWRRFPSFADIWGNFLIGKVRIMEARTDRSSIILLLSQIIRNTNKRDIHLERGIPWIKWAKCHIKVKTGLSATLWIDSFVTEEVSFCLLDSKFMPPRSKSLNNLSHIHPFRAHLNEKKIGVGGWGC